MPRSVTDPGRTLDGHLLQVREDQDETPIAGLAFQVGRLARATAQTMQRANSIGPGDLVVLSATPPSVRLATARATCSVRPTSARWATVPEAIIPRTSAVNRANSRSPT